MNIFICGQKSFGKEVLKALYEKGHNIVGVAPPPQEKYYDKMQGYAIKLGIPVISDCDRLVSRDIPEETDLVIAAHSHWYISTKIIEKAKESQVPTYKDNKLASTLSKLQIGDMIPPELYEVVAEILVFVDDMDRMKAKIDQAGVK